MSFSIYSRNAAAVFVVALLASGSITQASQLYLRDGSKVTERHLQDCQTICPSGSTMERPGSTLPIFSFGSSNCSSVDQLLASQDNTACAIAGVVESVLSLSAYCGCSGVQAPNLCATCTQGGMMVDPNRTITIEVLNATVSCQDGAALVPYVSSTAACQAFTTVFNQVCCGDATTVPGGSATGNPSPVAPTATSASSPSATPPPNTVSPSVVAGMTPAPTLKASSPSVSSISPNMAPSAMTPSPVLASSSVPSVMSSPNAMSPSAASSPPQIMTPSAATSVSSSPVPNTPSTFAASDSPSSIPLDSGMEPSAEPATNGTDRNPSNGRNSSSTSGALASYASHTPAVAGAVFVIVSALL